MLLMWKWMGLFLKKNHLLRYRDGLSLPNWIGAILAKTTCKKIGALIHLMKFLSPEVAMFLYKFTIGPCKEHCSDTPGLVLLVATWNCWISCKNRYTELLVLHLLPLFNPWHIDQNVTSLSLFWRYCFGRCSSKLAQLVPLPYSQGRSTCYSDRLHDFSVTIPRCYKDAYVNSFFPGTARLWNSLPIECFPFTYDLNGFKSRINRHLLTIGSSKQISCTL